MKATPQDYRTSPEAEPTSAQTAAPMWIIMATLVFLFLGAWYFDARGGWFEARVYSPYTRVPDNFLPIRVGINLKRAQTLFEANCAACHNNDGMGKPGQAPPLAGSEWVTANGVNRLIRIPRMGLAGAIEVKGQAWNLNMAAMGAKAAYSADDLSLILSYIRISWGNKASIVMPDQVEAVDKELGNRSDQYTVEELKKLPE